MNLDRVLGQDELSASVPRLLKLGQVAVLVQRSELRARSTKPEHSTQLQVESKRTMNHCNWLNLLSFGDPNGN
jgi:hypothetical protein